MQKIALSRFSPYRTKSLIKSFLIMKLSAILLIVGSLQASAKGFSQKITLSVKNAPAEYVFREIEKQTGYGFIYAKEQLAKLKPVNLDVQNTDLTTVLNMVFKEQVLTYTISGNNIAIKEKPVSKKEEMSFEPPPPFTVTGKILDENGKPLEGVSVVLKSTNKGVTTDKEGKFYIEVPQGGDVLVFSYVGYENTELKVTKPKDLSITLKQKNIKSEEIVVIGYGSQQQRKITGAIGTVRAKDFIGVPVTGLDQALQGRISGVQVTQNSGEPGGSVSIRIRGVGSINSTNEPLYIVDGVPYSSLNSINPNDIDRIDVLKDAAAASIYGSRASNGVVLVTTKRGRPGKVTVSLDEYAGIQSVYKKLELLNGPQFAKLANENLVNGGQTPNPAWSTPASVQNNDWQSSVLQNAPIQNYNVSISGGGEKSSSLFSFGYFDQSGIIVASNYKRYTARLNTDYAITKNFKVGITLNAAFEEKKSVASQDVLQGILQMADYMQPTSPIRTSQEGLFGLNPDGSINPNDSTYFGWEGYAFTSKYANISRYSSGVNNPLHAIKHFIRNPQKTQQLLASAFAEYTIIPGLKLRSTINLSFGNSFNIYSKRKGPSEIFRTSISSYTEYWDKANQWNWINTVSYSKNIGNHNIGVVAGIDALKNNYQYVDIGTLNVPDAQQVINASDNTSRVVSGFPSDFALLSYFGRVSYDYAGKYLLSASIRRDGSSKFGPINRYGVFPSASVGWRISEEKFMKSVAFINELKLRGSYGIVGNQNIPNFKYLSTYSNGGGTYQYTIGTGSSAVNAVYADNIGDPNIRWEKSIQTNIGIDVSFLKDKFTLTADYYIKKLDDLLGNFPVPIYTGINGNVILKNGFSMKNSGLEIALGYNQRMGSVNFSANANFSTLENKITKLTDNEKGYVAQGISLTPGGSFNDGGQTRTKVGERIGTFYGYVTNGIIQNATDLANSGLGGVALGDRLYKDLNNDGKINGDDKTALGNGLPKYIFGMNLRAEYKRFDISVLINGQAGVQIANMNRIQLYNMRWINTTGIVNGSEDLLKSWSGPGTSNELPRNAYTAPPSNWWFSSFYIENGAFVRIRNVQMGYSLPERISKKAGISHARIYIAAQNLHTFTHYTGYDPEIGSANQNVLTTGADFGRYPLSRMITVGINISFN